ncbi:WD repeat-containing protein 34 [Chytridiales sp. JEL 0842]|nr:WD repeat-containing protein 34 [Chytridiales sp. JEL 0842]
MSMFGSYGRLQTGTPTTAKAGGLASAKFKDCSTDPVEIASTWKHHKTALINGSVQTIPVNIVEKYSQSYSVRDEETQTIAETERGFKLLEKYDRESLRRFLSNVESEMSRELLQNINSTAFDGMFALLNSVMQQRWWELTAFLGYVVNWEEEVTTVTCQHVLKHKYIEPEFVCNDIAWSKTGSVVGVAYGQRYHDTWCVHRGHLCTWNLNLRDMNPDIATIAVETTLSIQSTNIPLVGEVTIWSLNEPDNPVVASSKINELTHQEPVAKVVWIPGSRFGQYDLMSVGNDGRVIIWNVDNKLNKPKAGAQLSNANVPRHLRPPESRSFALDIALGGTCISISNENKNEYMVGTESGLVFKCNTASVTPLDAYKKGDREVRYANPINAGYATHIGPVNAVSCSPFHRNLFLTCGSDGTAKLVNKLQSKNLLVWEPSSRELHSIQWSPFKPTVFAMVSADGSLYVYDLASHRSIPVLTLAASDKTGVATYSVAFNPRRPALLATGDAGGYVRVWRLSTILSTSEVRDTRIIETLGGVGEESENSAKVWA